MKIIMLGCARSGQRNSGKENCRKVWIFLIFQQATSSERILRMERNWAKKPRRTWTRDFWYPTSMVVDLVVDRVKQEDCKNGYVLDGFPRTIPQAEALDKALTDLGEKMDYAIDVDVPDENIVRRMSGRRCVRRMLALHTISSMPHKGGGYLRCMRQRTDSA